MTGYAIRLQGQTYTPNGQTDISDTDAHNQAIASAELAEWAKQPDRFAIYVTAKLATTWLGTRLGTISIANTYTNNLGARITCIRVRGTNGATYHGRYGADWSQLCRIRRCR